MLIVNFNINFEDVASLTISSSGDNPLIATHIYEFKQIIGQFTLLSEPIYMDVASKNFRLVSGKMLKFGREGLFVRQYLVTAMLIPPLVPPSNFRIMSMFFRLSNLVLLHVSSLHFYFTMNSIHHSVDLQYVKEF